MPDPIHAALKWISHNRYLFLGLVSALAVGTYTWGCESTTSSLSDPSRKISRSSFQIEGARLEQSLISDRAELDAAIAKFNAKVDASNSAMEAGVADLNRQDEIRAQILGTFTNLIPNLLAGKFDVASTIGTGVGLLGLLGGGGAVVDNKRKDRLLALKKSGTPPAA